ncbi:hypothetical protein TSAR_008860, partial [Trichomalopsis sarcophagae]
SFRPVSQHVVLKLRSTFFFDSTTQITPDSLYETVLIFNRTLTEDGWRDVNVEEVYNVDIEDTRYGPTDRNWISEISKIILDNELNNIYGKIGNLKKFLVHKDFLGKITTTVNKSRGEILLLILKFSISNELSFSGLVNLFKLINSMFETPILPDSRHIIDKLVNPKEGVEHHAVCQKCIVYLGKIGDIPSSSICNKITFSFESANQHLLNATKCAKGVSQQVVRFINICHSCSVVKEKVIHQADDDITSPNYILYFNRSDVDDQIITSLHLSSYSSEFFYKMTKNCFTRAYKVCQVIERIHEENRVVSTSSIEKILVDMNVDKIIYLCPIPNLLLY